MTKTFNKEKKTVEIDMQDEAYLFIQNWKKKVLEEYDTTSINNNYVYDIE